jgi:hypothetical protein
LFFSRVIWLTASAADEVGTSTITSTPSSSYHCPRDVGGDVGLVLVVGRDDLDVPALARDAEVLRRHARGHDRAFAGQVGIEAGAVVHHADLDVDVLAVGLAGDRHDCGCRNKRVLKSHGSSSLVDT